MNFAKLPAPSHSLPNEFSYGSSLTPAIGEASAASLITPFAQAPWQQASAATAIAFVDASVSDYQTLLTGMTPGTEVHLLDSSQDAVTQITNTLLGRHNISSVHIVSHGEDGGLNFGSSALNLTDLPQYAALLTSWSDALTNEADILLYGCNVAEGAVGQAFINIISQLTGADVAASNNLTGHSGDWNLEVSTGTIESSLIFDTTAIAAYGYDLNILGETFTGSDVTNPSWIYNTTGTQPFLTARSTVAPSTGGIPGGGADAVGSGALRLTAAAPDQASFVIYNRPINASSGFTITFAIHAYGGDGADGISFFLIDGTASPTAAGATGGALGYAYSQGGNASQGLAGGYLGIGLDEFGNFSTVGYGSGGAGQTPDSIAVRGSQANSYKYLAGTSTLTPGIDTPGNSRSAAQKVVQIDLTTAGLLSVKIDLNNDGIFSGANEVPTTLQNYDVVTNNGALPSTFKFGFSASTGGSTNIHEITGLDVSTFNNAPYIPLVNFTSSTTSVSEGAAGLNLTAQLDVAATTNVTVPVTLSGTAVNGTDYTLSGNTITILAGQLTGSITLSPINNTVVGSNKTAVVTLGSPTGAQLSPQNNVITATIVDNDYALAASGSPTYIENATPVVIAPTATITGDLTASTINSATVSLGSGFSSAEDRLGIQGQSGTSGTIASTSITWSYNTTSGVLTLSGAGTAANYQSALQQVAYSNLSDAPSAANRTVAYAINYNSSQQATSSSSPIVTVTPVNDAPTLTGNATLPAITQNTTNPSGSTITTLFGSLFNDVDAGASLSGLAIRGNTANATTEGKWQYSLNGTTWLDIGTVADGATALALSTSTLLRFVPVTGYNGTPGGLTVRALDNTYTNGFSTGTTRVTVDTTTTGGVTPIAAAVSSLSTSVAPSLPNLVWRNSTSGENVIWSLSNFALATRYSIPSITDPAWQIANSTTDFDRDGDADILWRNRVTGETTIWGMSRTAYKATYVLDRVTDLNWQIATTADFNGDGSPDILWRNARTGENIVWQMNGFALQSKVFIQQAGDINWQIASAADFNGDSKADILWRNARTGENVVWQMNGLAFQSVVPIQAAGDINWQIAGTADFNGDSKPDILWRNRATGDNIVWQMNGYVFQSPTVLPQVPNLNWRVAGVADLGGTSAPEILWLEAQAGNEVIWQLNGFSHSLNSPLPSVNASSWSVTPFVVAGINSLPVP